MFSIEPLDYTKGINFTATKLGDETGAFTSKGNLAKKGQASSFVQSPLEEGGGPLSSSRLKNFSSSFQRQVERSKALAKEDPDRDLLAKKETLMQKKLWNAAKGLETILINQMFKSMQSTLEGDKLIGENSGTKIFKDFLNSERSKIVAENSDFGVARAIYKANVKYL